MPPSAMQITRLSLLLSQRTMPVKGIAQLVLIEPDSAKLQLANFLRGKIFTYPGFVAFNQFD